MPDALLNCPFMTARRRMLRLLARVTAIDMPVIAVPGIVVVLITWALLFWAAPSSPWGISIISAPVSTWPSTKVCCPISVLLEDPILTENALRGAAEDEVDLAADVH